MTRSRQFTPVYTLYVQTPRRYRFLPMSPFLILVVLALIFAVLSMVPPMSTWPMLAVSVIFLAVSLLIGKG